MKLVRPAALAGLVLVAGALPVTAFALSSGVDPTPPPTASRHATTGDAADEPGTDEPGTDGPGSESPETDAPDSETSGDDTATEPETSGQPNPASAPGRAHAAAMQIWAHCVGEAASGPKTPGQPMPPKLACGPKPVAPGVAKHQSATAPDAGAAPQEAPRAPGKAAHGKGHGKAHGKAHPHGKRR